MKLTKELKEKAIYISVRVLVGIIGVLMLSFFGDRYDGKLDTPEVVGIILIVLAIIGQYIVAFIYKLLGK